MSDRGTATLAGSNALAESNAAILERYMTEVWNNGNFAVAHELVAGEMLVHGAGGQVVKQGPDGVIGLVTAWREAFPDGRMVVHEYISEGDLVADRMTWEGTHAGDFYGIPATGRPVRCTSIGSDRIVDGKIVEGWGELDMLGMMQRLGALPAVFPDTSGTWEDDPADPADPAGDGVDPDAAKDAALRWFDRLGAGDEAGLRDAVEAGFVDHNPTVGRGDLGSAMDFHAMLRASLPDLAIAPVTEHVIAQGDRVLVRWRATGTHDGAPLLGAQPSGTAVEWTGSDIFRIHAGRCAQRWASADLLSLTKQLGVAG